MKRKLLCMLACMSLFCSNISAETNIEKDNCKYTVTADCKEDEKVTMLVVKEGSKLDDVDIVAVREGKGKDEKVVFSFEFEEGAQYEGPYIIYLMNNGSGVKTDRSFTHAMDTTIADAKTGLESADETTLETVITNPAYRNAFEAMGMNCEAYDGCTPEQQQKILDMVIAEKETYDDLVKLMNSSIGVVMINDGEDMEKALSCAMPEFEGITYEKADDDLKLWLKDVMRGNYSKTKDFEDRYNEACMLYKFNTARFSQFSTLFSTYASALNITDTLAYQKYSAITDAKVKSAVGDKLVDKLKASVKSTDALLAVLDSACDEAIAEKKAGNNSASQGGGGGGSSGVIASGGGSGSTPQPVPQNNSHTKYKDTGSTLWAENAINLLSARNIISGDGDGNFRPNDAVTRAEFAKMLITAIGGLNEGAVSKFADLDRDAWYYKYVSSAYEAGIVSGVSETEFGVGKPITRQEMAVMISRALRIYKEMPDMREKTEFTDKNEIADWAKDDVDTLYCKGIMSGLEEGMFEPRSGATRAQAAVVIYNLIK